MRMAPSTRFLLMIACPFLALVLGWQLGVRYEMQTFAQQQHQLIQVLTGASGSGNTVQADPEKEVNIGLLWDTWRILMNSYIEPSDLNAQKMVYGAISGMVAAVGDPYTVFMTPTDSKSFQDVMEGNLEGIGAELENRNGQIVIVAPLKGSPAEKAGLKPEDVILKVNDADVSGKKLEDIVALIRGHAGTTVSLTINRVGVKAPVVVKLTRQSIHVPSVESKVIKTATGSVGYVALNQFGNESSGEVMKAIQGFPQKDIKGIILDLRYNGGGLLDGAVDIVSMFVKEGKVVTVEERGRDPEVHNVTGNPIAADVPLVVLINEGSASASEITAGALQDLSRAKIIGMQSFGKGTVQQVIDLPGGAGLRVTVARWLTPSGHNLGKKGVTPDIVIDRTDDDFKAGRDPQLLAAQEWLLDHRNIGKTGSGTMK